MVGTARVVRASGHVRVDWASTDRSKRAPPMDSYTGLPSTPASWVARPPTPRQTLREDGGRAPAYVRRHSSRATAYRRGHAPSRHSARAARGSTHAPEVTAVTLATLAGPGAGIKPNGFSPALQRSEGFLPPHATASRGQIQKGRRSSAGRGARSPREASTAGFTVPRGHLTRTLHPRPTDRPGALQASRRGAVRFFFLTFVLLVRRWRYDLLVAFISSVDLSYLVWGWTGSGRVSGLTTAISCPPPLRSVLAAREFRKSPAPARPAPVLLFRPTVVNLVLMALSRDPLLRSPCHRKVRKGAHAGHGRRFVGRSVPLCGRARLATECSP